MPSDEVGGEFKIAVGTRHAMLHDVYCVADGLSLYLEQPSDCDIHNMFYHG